MLSFLLSLLLTHNPYADTNPDIWVNVATVVYISEEQDWVFFEDSMGHIWELDGIEDWDVGDVGGILMYNNETECIYDDIIVGAHYQYNVKTFVLHEEEN